MGHHRKFNHTLALITTSLLEDEIDFRSLSQSTDQLFRLLMEVTEMSGIESGHRQPLLLPDGKGIGPYWAAMCVNDMLRTRKFVRGLYFAIKEAQKIFPLLLQQEPDFVFLGLRYPKQEMLIVNLHNKLKAANSKMPLFFNLGASYEFYTGMKSRAPKWMQNIGLEWLHRFLSEPKRTFKRYFYDDLYIFILFLKEFLRK